MLRSVGRRSLTPAQPTAAMQQHDCNQRRCLRTYTVDVGVNTQPLKFEEIDWTHANNTCVLTPAMPWPAITTESTQSNTALTSKKIARGNLRELRRMIQATPSSNTNAAAAPAPAQRGKFGASTDTPFKETSASKTVCSFRAMIATTHRPIAQSNRAPDHPATPQKPRKPNAAARRYQSD